MRRAALALALLAAAPAYAQTGGEPPAFTVIQAPVYSVGDFWDYRVVQVGPNASASPTQSQLVRVLRLSSYEGVPAYELFTTGVQEVRGDDQTGSVYASSNKTSWVSRDAHKLLRIEEEVDRTQLHPRFNVWQHRSTNWTFRQPMDVFQFPLVKDDTWVVLTDAFVESNSTIATHAEGNPRNVVPPRYESTNISQSSTTSWVRADRLNISGRTFEGVLLVSQSGGATVRDFYSPQVGNLVRREILNESGALVETSTLVAFKFAQAPRAGDPAPMTTQGGFNWLLVGAAAAAGIVAALLALAFYNRVRKPSAPPTERPPDAPPAAPPEQPAEAPPTPPSPPEQPPPGNP